MHMYALSISYMVRKTYNKAFRSYTSITMRKHSLRHILLQFDKAIKNKNEKRSYFLQSSMSSSLTRLLEIET